VRVCAHLKVVGAAPVAEDVDKQRTAGAQPAAAAAHEFLVVLHVLKHLNRQDAVVRAWGLRAAGQGAVRMRSCSYVPGACEARRCPLREQGQQGASSRASARYGAAWVWSTALDRVQQHS